MDGQVQRDASIVIKDNDVYDFPYLYFYLTLEITAGKATIGQYSVIRVEVRDDGDRSAPGLMIAPMLTKATGGMLALAWIPPENAGGENLWITGYSLSIRVGSSVKWLVTPTNATTLPYGGLNADTKHSFSIYAINAIGPGPSSPVVTFATTNFTAPGPPAQIDLVTQTGGLITVNISVPIDAGGSPITGYLIYISEHDVGYQLAYNGTGQPTHVMIPVSVGKPDTRYAFQAQAVNFVGAGDTSDAFYFVSGPISRPGPPRLPSTYSATGGSISITLQPPLDTGGQEDISYMIYYREQGSGTRFRKAYCNAQDLEITIFRVAASTVYDLVAVSVLEEDANQLTMGTINISDSSIVLDDNVTSDIMNSGFFEFCDFIFEVDTTQTQDGNTIQYLELLSTGDSAPASMRLDSGDSCGVYVRGAFSLSSDFATTSITKPGVPPAPTESDYSDNTGGALFIAISWPDDIGGVPITGYEFYLDNQSVKGELKGYQNTTMFDLSVTVEIVSPDAVRRRPSPSATTGSTTRRLTSTDVGTSIYVQAGGLLPSTTYTFTVQVANGVGASDMTNGAKDATSVATVPGAPDPPTAILITGGSMELSWTDPVDSGGAPLISYKLSVNRSGSEVGKCEGMFLSCTIGNLLSITDYVVTLVAYNPVGASPPSAVTPFTTKVTSLPQAPQGVHVAEVSNTSVTIHWDPCLDFGGGYVETYQVDIVQTLNTSIAFSGRVPVAQLNYSMDGLTPSTDYSTTVRAVTGDSQLGNASKVVFFRTPQFANQPRPPAVGCHSRTVANVYWKAEDDAISYLLYRNGQLLHDNGEDVTFEDAITLGKTYSYQVRCHDIDF
ncbi:hypothetical protein PR003_g984 [Phytophthora rubi]|uniref:Fibronectin type-III domain-containing protein n=1 Tax=Phytophthora rubi TaxID=129364 RepID=A0A6A4G985_9STRA|nr:hypothetical protein PR003_g984 [Phytophthora rubi]